MDETVDRNKRAEIRMRKKVVADILQSVPDYIQKVQCDTSIWTQPFKCAVLSCPNIFKSYNPDSPQKFHNFPLDSEVQQVWLKQCRVPPDFDVNASKVCTDHFLPNDYLRNFKLELTDPLFKRTLKATAIPTQLLEGMEVNIVDLPDIEAAVIDTLERAEIREAVDENALLKEKHEQMMSENGKLMTTYANLHKRYLARKRRLWLLKKKLDQFKKNPTTKEQKNVLIRVFSESQINVLLNKEKVFWSNDDMAMAFTLRQMGNKEVYLYLKKTLNFPLPSLSSVQRWAASK